MTLKSTAPNKQANTTQKNKLKQINTQHCYELATECPKQYHTRLSQSEVQFSDSIVLCLKAYNPHIQKANVGEMLDL